MYYRNKTDLTSIEGVEVEAESLWQQKTDVLVLVDDDQYVTSPLTNNFYKVNPN